MKRIKVEVWCGKHKFLWRREGNNIKRRAKKSWRHLIFFSPVESLLHSLLHLRTSWRGLYFSWERKYYALHLHFFYFFILSPASFFLAWNHISRCPLVWLTLTPVAGRTVFNLMKELHLLSFRCLYAQEILCLVIIVSCSFLPWHLNTHLRMHNFDYTLRLWFSINQIRGNTELSKT